METVPHGGELAFVARESATGVPTLPHDVAGVPIVITDSLSNAEA